MAYRALEERVVALSPIERDRILSLDPSFQSVLSSHYFDNWDLPCPVQVRVAAKAGPVDVVLRKCRAGSVERESTLLRALADYGLPVPAVLLAPFHNERRELAAVYSLLPGQTLQNLSSLSEESLSQATGLWIQAWDALGRATNFLRHGDIGTLIPHCTLAEEWGTLSSEKHPWLDQPLFRDALAVLESPLSEINQPLLFTNGDMQPGNLLELDGRISGYLDFEAPVFRDPLMALVKFPIDDLYPLCRSDLIQTALRSKGWSARDFAPRLALGCLQKLRKDVPVTGGTDAQITERKRVLWLLEQSLKPEQASEAWWRHYPQPETADMPARRAEGNAP